MKNALLDFAQGASNAAADTVVAPVDGIAWLLRKAGLPVPQAPVGGSDWMAQRGLRAKPRNALAGALGESAGLISPMVAAARAPQIVNALLKAGENAARPSQLGAMGQRGAIVWHGSPHKFDAFDSSKIGTGEGAQAYGHGVYFAESPDVARGYQTKLAGGTLVDSRGIPADPTATTAELQKKLRAAGLGWDEAERAASGWSSAVFNGKTSELHPIVQQEIAAMGLAPKMQGALYKVDLPDEKIARMLDWDKPLHKQPKHVRKFLQSEIGDRLGRDTYAQWIRNRPDWRDFQDNMMSHLPTPEVTEKARAAGIPGIRYLDGGSRGAGAGTSNYVVFPGEENALRILERNGQALR